MLDRAKNMATIGRMMAEKRTGESFASNKRGQSAMADRAVQVIVALTVGGLVAAFLLPIAIDEIVAVDTSSWGSGAESMWNVLDVIIVLVVFLFFIGLALAKRRRS